MGVRFRAKKKPAPAKFKVGDKVKCVFNDKDTQEYVGSVGYITEVRKRENYPYGVSFCDDARFSEEELAAFGEIRFILQYDLEVDPIEFFSTMEEVQARIQEIAKNPKLKRDSIHLYEVGKHSRVSIETRVTIKEN